MSNRKAESQVNEMWAQLQEIEKDLMAYHISTYLLRDRAKDDQGILMQSMCMGYVLAKLALGHIETLSLESDERIKDDDEV